MFNLGFSEILMLSIIALIVIGPKQLPQVARSIGRFINELKRATGDISKSFTSVDKQISDLKRDAQESLKDKIGLEQIGLDEIEDELKHIDKPDKPDQENS